MFRYHFLMGCLMIVAGLAWPALTVVYGVHRLTPVFRSAVEGHQPVANTQRSEIKFAVEDTTASILGGVIVCMFGMVLAMGVRRDLADTASNPTVSNKS